MSSIGPATPGTAWFLNGIANLDAQQSQVERQITSGYQIQDAADSPQQTPQLIDLGSQLAAVQAYQTNLSSVQAEANSADQALSSAISLIQNAQSLASEGANSTSSAATRQNLATQVQGLQQQLVSIANTQVEGRYIFGGDADQTAPATGVAGIAAQTSTRVITDTQGQPVYQGLTAQQIFDPPSAAPPAASPNSTFAALQSLATALAANNTAGISAAAASLGTASSWVSQQQAYYGDAEQTITAQQTAASSQIVSLQTEIGGIRDTNVTQAATELTQLSTDQSAAFSAQASISRKSLFDYLA